MSNPFSFSDPDWVQNLLVSIPLVGAAFVAFRRWAGAKDRAEARRLREQLAAQRTETDRCHAEDLRHADISKELQIHSEDLRGLHGRIDDLRDDMARQTDRLSAQITELTSAVLNRTLPTPR